MRHSDEPLGVAGLRAAARAVRAGRAQLRPEAEADEAGSGRRGLRRLGRVRAVGGRAGREGLAPRASPRRRRTRRSGSKTPSSPIQAKSRDSGRASPCPASSSALPHRGARRQRNDAPLSHRAQAAGATDTHPEGHNRTDGRARAGRTRRRRESAAPETRPQAPAGRGLRRSRLRPAARADRSAPAKPRARRAP
jgi:hypothetical protein